MITFFEIWVAIKYLLPKTRERFFTLITIFSFLGISLGVATLIIVMSVMNGFRDELTSKIMGVNGHLKIQSINNFKLNEENKLIQIIENIEGINSSVVLTNQALLTKESYSSGVLIKGVEKKYFLDRKIFQGDLGENALMKFKNNKGIFVGEKLKKKFNIKIGDDLNILSSNSFSTILGNIPRSGNFKVIGFFDTGMYEYDTSLIFFPIDLMQSFLNLGKQFDFLEIQVSNYDYFDKKKMELRNLIPEYLKILDWRNLNPSLFNALEVERNVMFLILLLIIIVAAFNLVSSMIILVSTKSKDIGVLRVLGVKRRQLLKIFIINGVIIGFLGTLLGLLLGLTFCLNINEIKSFIELFTESQLFAEEIYFFTKLPVIIDYSQIIKIILISLFLSFVSTIYPSIKASRVDPINLIKWD